MTSLEIEAFLTIVQYGSISASAKELYVTQPALSRRLKALESEVGCELIKRQKGIQTVQLTEAGKLFLPVAEKWRYLWEETGAIKHLDQKPLIRMSSIESVSAYLFPEIFRTILEEQKYNLEFHLYHSREAYGYVESGLVDIAFISNPMYSKSIQTIPLFSEPFVLASRFLFENVSGIVKVGDLNPREEVRLPWNQEFDFWHRKWFDDTIYPNVFLDQMSLMEEFLTGTNWAIVPWSVGEKLKEKNIFIYQLENGPEDRITYYLVKNNDKQEIIEHILKLIKEYLTDKSKIKLEIV